MPITARCRLRVHAGTRARVMRADRPRVKTCQGVHGCTRCRCTGVKRRRVVPPVSLCLGPVVSPQTLAVIAPVHLSHLSQEQGALPTFALIIPACFLPHHPSLFVFLLFSSFKMGGTSETGETSAQSTGFLFSHLPRGRETAWDKDAGRRRPSDVFRVCQAVS